MIGTLHIVLAMKPLEGNFTQNALKHGVAGLNIDGARIGTGDDRISGGLRKREMDDGSSWKHGSDSQLKRPEGGRWPSNVLLGHLEGCKKVGVKKVKGNHGDLGVYHGDTRSWKNQSVEGINRIGYADVDGNETIDAWECQEGCPVKAMDEQSGVRKTTWASKSHKNNRKDGFLGAVGHPGEQGFNDTGGASRFFKQVRRD